MAKLLMVLFGMMLIESSKQSQSQFLKFGSELTLQLAPQFVNATLQKGEPVAVWGWGAQPNAMVHVTLGNRTEVAVSADNQGRWSAVIPPQPVTWSTQLLVSSNGKFDATMVRFGVVLLCSGQSNMGMPVGDYNKSSFHADNGTAECAAAGRYSEGIQLMTATQTRYTHGVLPMWETIFPTPPDCKPGFLGWPRCASNLAKFSAVCWYTGKALYNALDGKVPVGLMLAAVGGSPIEYWLPPSGSVDNQNPCEVDKPQCDITFNDSYFFLDIVQQFTQDGPNVTKPDPGPGYTVGGIVWDQAERDVKCPVSLSAYSCMQRYLINSWRQRLGSPHAAFVAVQLPGYTGAIANGSGVFPGQISSAMVFTMREQQAAGCQNVSNASFVPTYDMSCPTSPYGSVHNVEKGKIGERIAAQLLAIFDSGGKSAQDLIGPKPISVSVIGTNGGTQSFVLKVSAGTAPWALRSTKNCTTCCAGSAPTGKITDPHTIDLDVLSAGGKWVNATGAVVDPASGSISFSADLDQTPLAVRHTGASIFPQCTLYASEGLPLIPFLMNVTYQ